MNEPKKPLILDIDNVYARNVWNKAIEEAAKMLENYQVMNRADEIRKLKK